MPDMITTAVPISRLIGKTASIGQNLKINSALLMAPIASFDHFTLTARPQSNSFEAHSSNRMVTVRRASKNPGNRKSIATRFPLLLATSLSALLYYSKSELAVS